jgi:hypothetical protein
LARQVFDCGKNAGVMRSRFHVADCRNKTYIHRRDAESAKKIILDVNELIKRILGLAIAVRSVTIGETVFFKF